MNPDDPLAQELLKVYFVTKAWPDIHKKLQKIEGWSEQPIETLLRETQKVYVRRGEEKEKRKAKLMVSTVNQIMKQKISDRGRHFQEGLEQMEEEEKRKNNRQRNLSMSQSKLRQETVFQAWSRRSPQTGLP